MSVKKYTAAPVNRYGSGPRVTSEKLAPSHRRPAVRHIHGGFSDLNGVFSSGMRHYHGPSDRWVGNRGFSRLSRRCGPREPPRIPNLFRGRPS